MFSYSLMYNNFFSEPISSLVTIFEKFMVSLQKKLLTIPREI